MYDVRFAYVDPTAICGRLIRNPNYGGPAVGPFGWTWRPEISKAQKPEFHNALRESIAEEGVRNPVLLWSFPEGLFLTFGGSRVAAAISCGIGEVPAIINDYTGAYEQAPRVDDSNYQTYFRDVPRDTEFGPQGFDYHYNLERARRQNHDPAGFAWTDEDSGWVEKEFPWLVEK